MNNNDPRGGHCQKQNEHERPDWEVRVPTKVESRIQLHLLPFLVSVVSSALPRLVSPNAGFRAGCRRMKGRLVFGHRL